MSVFQSRIVVPAWCLLFSVGFAGPLTDAHPDYSDWFATALKHPSMESTVGWMPGFLHKANFTIVNDPSDETGLFDYCWGWKKPGETWSSSFCVGGVSFQAYDVARIVQTAWFQKSFRELGIENTNRVLARGFPGAVRFEESSLEEISEYVVQHVLDPCEGRDAFDPSWNGFHRTRWKKYNALWYARVAMLACRLHEHGKTDHANKLMHALVQTTPGGLAAITVCLQQQLLCEQYLAIVDTFVAKPDAEKYAENLRLFRDGAAAEWVLKDLLEKELQRINTCVESQWEPSQQYLTLPDRSKKVYDRVVVCRDPQKFVHSKGLQTILFTNEQWDMYRYTFLSTYLPVESVGITLRGLGMGGWRVLIAMRSDHRLLPVRNKTPRNAWYSLDASSSEKPGQHPFLTDVFNERVARKLTVDGLWTAQKIQKDKAFYYGTSITPKIQLPGPIRVRDFAKQELSSQVMRVAQQNDNLDTNDVFDHAQALADEWDGKSREEISRGVLAKGRPFTQLHSMAFAVLLNSPSEETRKVAKDKLLSRKWLGDDAAFEDEAMAFEFTVQVIRDLWFAHAFCGGKSSHAQSAKTMEECRSALLQAEGVLSKELYFPEPIVLQGDETVPFHDELTYRTYVTKPAGRSPINRTVDRSSRDFWLQVRSFYSDGKPEQFFAGTGDLINLAYTGKVEFFKRYALCSFFECPQWIKDAQHSYHASPRTLSGYAELVRILTPIHTFCDYLAMSNVLAQSVSRHNAISGFEATSRIHLRNPYTIPFNSARCPDFKPAENALDELHALHAPPNTSQQELINGLHSYLKHRLGSPPPVELTELFVRSNFREILYEPGLRSSQSRRNPFGGHATDTSDRDKKVVALLDEYETEISALQPKALRITHYDRTKVSKAAFPEIECEGETLTPKLIHSFIRSVRSEAQNGRATSVTIAVAPNWRGTGIDVGGAHAELDSDKAYDILVTMYDNFGDVSMRFRIEDQEELDLKTLQPGPPAARPYSQPRTNHRQVIWESTETAWPSEPVRILPNDPFGPASYHPTVDQMVAWWVHARPYPFRNKVLCIDVLPRRPEKTLSVESKPNGVKP